VLYMYEECEYLLMWELQVQFHFSYEVIYCLEGSICGVFGRLGLYLSIFFYFEISQGIIWLGCWTMLGECHLFKSKLLGHYASEILTFMNDLWARCKYDATWKIMVACEWKSRVI